MTAFVSLYVKLQRSRLQQTPTAKRERRLNFRNVNLCRRQKEKQIGDEVQTPIFDAVMSRMRRSHSAFRDAVNVRFVKVLRG